MSNVSQGSKLGPFLFLNYRNDFHLAIKFTEMQFFRDGTNILSLNDQKTCQLVSNLIII